MPPIVAIALALLTKEVYLSLFAGCALGALLAAEFHPWIAFDTLFNTMIDSVDFSILMFMILLGMIVMLMQESGGTRAYGEWASGHLKSKRSALVTTSLLGALIFVDDYFNCLTVGSVMRPVTDKYKVSRAKLAYIIDATAAPVCIIAPISSWAAAVNSYVPAGSSMSGFEMFVKTIPFNLYAILTLYMVFFTSIVGFDFGLMKKHEENAAKGDLFTSGGEEFQNQETKDPTEGGKYAKGKVIDLIAPMVVMIATAIAAMIWTGHLNGGQNLVEDFANCSSSEALVFAGLVTVGFLLLLYLPRRVIGFKDFMNSVPEGGKLMMPAILILVLAWTLKGMTDALGIGTFVRSAINLNSSLMNFVPLVIFCIAIFIAFSSGTSWGTFAIFVPFAHREHIGCTVDYVAGRNRYMGYLISLGIYSFKGVKVGLDCANGASWNIAKSVFDALGADTYVINNKPNGTNINNNAGSTHIEGLQKFVVEKGLDVGFAYDGDADRCLCVDEKGNVITGDHILYIYGCYMKERGKLLTNTVVTTVMSNFGLYKAFDEQGIGYAKTAVGDKYVYEYMAKNGCRIGGEQSGHIIFSKYASTGDGILTSLKMMEVMLAKKMPMSKLAEPLKIYPQVLENVRVTDKKAAQNDPAVQEAVKAVAEALGDTGRILVRESGTEPLVRVMVEAPDHDTCQKYVDEVVNVIDSKGYRV